MQRLRNKDNLKIYNSIITLTTHFIIVFYVFLWNAFIDMYKYCCSCILRSYDYTCPGATVKSAKLAHLQKCLLLCTVPVTLKCINKINVFFIICHCYIYIQNQFHKRQTEIFKYKSQPNSNCFITTFLFLLDLILWPSRPSMLSELICSRCWRIPDIFCVELLWLTTI